MHDSDSGMIPFLAGIGTGIMHLSPGIGIGVFCHTPTELLKFKVGGRDKHVFTPLVAY